MSSSPPLRQEAQAPQDTQAQTVAGMSIFRQFNDEFLKSMEAVASLSAKGPSYVLFGIGGTMIIMALFFKLSVFGIGISALQPSEFIALLLVSALLLVCGSLLRLYQYRYEQEVSRSLKDAGIQIINRTLDVGAGLADPGNPPKTPGGL